MGGIAVVGAIFFPREHVPKHLARSTWISSSAIPLLLVTIIFVLPRSHPLSVTCRMSTKSKPLPANETSNTKGTRYNKDTRIQTKTWPNYPLYPTFHQIHLHLYSVPFAVGADCPCSRFIGMVLTMLCPPSLDPHPRVMRWSSQSFTAATNMYSLLHPSHPGLMRQCSQTGGLQVHAFIPVWWDCAHDPSPWRPTHTLRSSYIVPV